MTTGWGSGRTSPTGDSTPLGKYHRSVGEGERGLDKGLVVGREGGAAGAAELFGGGQESVNVFLVKIQVIAVDEGLDVILGNEVEAGNFDFLCGVPGQRVALMQPERLFLDSVVARLFS